MRLEYPEYNPHQGLRYAVLSNLKSSTEGAAEGIAVEMCPNRPAAATEPGKAVWISTLKRKARPVPVLLLRIQEGCSINHSVDRTNIPW